MIHAKKAVIPNNRTWKKHQKSGNYIVMVYGKCWAPANYTSDLYPLPPFLAQLGLSLLGSSLLQPGKLWKNRVEKTGLRVVMIHAKKVVIPNNRTWKTHLKSGNYIVMVYGKCWAPANYTSDLSPLPPFLAQLGLSLLGSSVLQPGKLWKNRVEKTGLRVVMIHAKKRVIPNNRRWKKHLKSGNYIVMVYGKCWAPANYTSDLYPLPSFLAQLGLSLLGSSLLQPGNLWKNRVEKTGLRVVMIHAQKAVIPANRTWKAHLKSGNYIVVVYGKCWAPANYTSDLYPLPSFLAQLGLSLLGSSLLQPRNLWKNRVEKTGLRVVMIHAKKRVIPNNRTWKKTSEEWKLHSHGIWQVLSPCKLHIRSLPPASFSRAARSFSSWFFRASAWEALKEPSGENRSACSHDTRQECCYC